MTQPMTSQESSAMEIKVEPWGPNPNTIASASRAALAHREVQAILAATRHRLLSVELVDADTNKPDQPTLPDRYRATFYDYTNNRAIVADGSLHNLEQILVSESGIQPLPSSEEFAEAVDLLRQDKVLGTALSAGALRPYRPMPPLIGAEAQRLDGRVERIIAVGLLPEVDQSRHEIVGVNMITRTILRFPAQAPRTAMANSGTCGLANANQSGVGNSHSGRNRFVAVPGHQAGSNPWAGSLDQRHRHRIALRRLSRQAGPLPGTCSYPQCELS